MIQARHYRRFAACISWLLMLGPIAPGITRGQSPPRVNQALAAQISYLRFIVASGRLAATSPEYARTDNSTARTGDVQENLAINVEDGLPTLRYTLTAPDATVDLEVTRGEQFRLLKRRTTPELQDELLFEQPVTGPLVVSLTQGNTTRIVRASNIWTLLLAERRLCAERVLPLFEMLHPGWLLAEQALQLEDALFRFAQQPQNDARLEWHRLVAQLGSERFADRQAADRRLRQYGTAIVPFLQQLPLDRLDAEQRSRIRRIEFDLAGAVQEDLPENVVTWLAADRQCWLALLDRDDPSRRKLAKAQLESLVGSSIEFDADAAPEVRAAQLARLRAAYEPGRTP